MDIYKTLSAKEKEGLYLLLTSSGITKGEIIAINKGSRGIKKFSATQWNELINQNASRNWSIIIERL